MKGLIGLLIFVSSLANAGGTVGNGGNVIVCKDKTFMLDVYEADSLRGFKLDLGSPDLIIEQKVQRGIDRIFRLDPYKATSIKTYADYFLGDTKFVRNVTLNTVDDSNEIFLPDGCTRQQIAIQNNVVVPSDPFYVVNEDLWDQLDNDNKAVLILHESIYRASNDKWPSPEVRLLNSVLFSTAFDGKSQFDYFAFIGETDLIPTMIAGVASDGYWYYQLPTNKMAGNYFPGNSPNGYYMDGPFATTSDSTLDDFSKHFCDGPGEVELTVDDLPRALEVAEQFDREYGTVNLPNKGYINAFAYGKDGTPHQYTHYTGDTDFRIDQNKPPEANYWCKGKAYPLAH